MQNRSSYRAFGLILLLLSLLLAGCAPQVLVTPDVTSTPQPLTGEVTRAQVRGATGWESLDAADWSPADTAVRQIQENAGEVEVLLFLGTWCGDSQRETPRFFKLMDQAGIAESQVRIIALDRSKKDAAGLTDQYGIEYVPTFIFVRDGAEIGRIVETPDGSLDGNIAAILAGG